MGSLGVLDLSLKGHSSLGTSLAPPQTQLDYRCKVCDAHATGFHFQAQSCSACCAFFRRAVAMKKSYKCLRAGREKRSKVARCMIVYSEFVIHT